MFRDQDKFYSVSELIEKLETRVYKKGRVTNPSTVNGKEVKTNLFCHELNGVSFTLMHWADRVDTLERLGYDEEFMEADLLDRLSPVALNPGEAIRYDTSGVLARSLDDQGKLNYTYSERMCFQNGMIIQALQQLKDTRQAFLSIWDPTKDIHLVGRGRVPCSIGFHFYIEDDKLNMIYVMRSLNINGNIGNDIYTSTRLLEHFAEKVGVQVGTVQFFCFSLHIIE